MGLVGKLSIQNSSLGYRDLTNVVSQILKSVNIGIDSMKKALKINLVAAKLELFLSLYNKDSMPYCETI